MPQTQIFYSLYLFNPISKTLDIFNYEIKSNHIKPNQIYICPKHTLHIENKIFLKHIYENWRRGGIESQGLFNTQPPLESQFLQWCWLEDVMLNIILLMGWRELELLERIQFVNVQESVKERSGTFFLGVEHIKIIIMINDYWLT